MMIHHLESGEDQVGLMLRGSKHVENASGGSACFMCREYSKGISR